MAPVFPTPRAVSLQEQTVQDLRHPSLPDGALRCAHLQQRCCSPLSAEPCHWLRPLAVDVPVVSAGVAGGLEMQLLQAL